jgi:hypothetical protein
MAALLESETTGDKREEISRPSSSISSTHGEVRAGCGTCRGSTPARGTSPEALFVRGFGALRCPFYVCLDLILFRIPLLLVVLYCLLHASPPSAGAERHLSYSYMRTQIHPAVQWWR